MSAAAVIDVGTNSVKLTVADTNAGVVILKEESRVTRLGRGVDRSRMLTRAGMDQTLAAVEDFAGTAFKLGASRVVAAGTSALRDAANGQEFIDIVHRATGITIEIIAGEREADLSYLAVTGDISMDIPADRQALVFDIGGGSTELIVGQNGRPSRHTSIDIGAVRITERFLPSDPVTENEYGAACKYIEEEIKKFSLDPKDAQLVCGIGGTATNLASVVLQTTDVHGKNIPAAKLAEWVARLRSMTTQERKNVAYLDPTRADIIVGGASIIGTLLSICGCDQYRVSVRGMRYGLLLEQAEIPAPERD